MKNRLLSLLPVILLTSLAVLEWISWVPGHSYLTDLLSITTAAGFYLAVVLLAASATAILTAGFVRQIMIACSFHVWRRSSLPVRLSEGTKTGINLILPCTLVAIAAGSLYAFLPKAKSGHYDDAMGLAAVMYTCMVLVAVCRGLALPHIATVRFGNGTAPVYRKEAQDTLLLNMPPNSITYVKSKTDQVWQKLQDRYGSVRLKAGDSVVCLDPSGLFSFHPIELRGTDYVIAVDLACRPNIESFPQQCYATSILSVERFLQLDATQRVSLVKAHLSTVKNLIDKQLASHKALLLEALGNSALGNFIGPARGQSALFEDRRELDAMRLAFSSQVSNAVMGVRSGSAICDIELSVSGFEFSGLLKQETDLLIEGIKSGTLRAHEVKLKMLEIIVVHGPGAADSIAGIGHPAQPGHRKQVSDNEMAGSQDAPKSRHRTECGQEVYSAVATRLRKAGRVTTKLLYDLYRHYQMVPDAMHGSSEIQLMQTLEKKLNAPFVKLADPDSDFYTGPASSYTQTNQ